MPDRYLSLVNSPVGSTVAARIGLPRPAPLRRFAPGEPLLHGPALVGSTTGSAPADLVSMVAAAGAQALPEPLDAVQYGAIVLDARTVRDPAELAVLRGFLAPAVRALLP